MKNLGKIVLFLLCMQQALFADVKASLDNRLVYSGEMVTYSLTINGNAVQKPTLSDICGNEVLATSSQTSIESINGSYSKRYTLSYQFMPKDSCRIEPVAVEIDGKTEYSNAIDLRVKAPSQEKNALFILKLEAPKERLYVGEPFELTLTLKQSLRAQAVDSRFVPPVFEGFWLKSQSEPERVDDGEYVITTLHYRLAPQREGNLTIKPAQLQIASRGANINSWGSFSPQVSWRSYYSNELHINAQALPNDVSLIGDFTLKTELKRSEINANEALNLEVVVEGVGNLEDIKSFKPYVENVNVFDEKIVIDGDKLTQKLAFVSDANFTIPAFEIIFFNTQTQKVQKIQTEPIDIRVVGSGPKEPLHIERQESAEENLLPQAQQQQTKGNDTITLLLVFAGGLVLGALLSLAFVLQRPKLFQKRHKEVSLKDEKLLLMKLLPFEDDKEVKMMIEKIEQKIYSQSKEPLDKKLLKELLKRHNIS